MKSAGFKTVCLLAGWLLAAAHVNAAEPVRLITVFDNDWRFLKGDAPGAEKPDFDDAGWRKLDAPHDWSIEGPFDQQHKTGGAGAWLPAGVGWYRKSFTLPASYAARRVFIEFDGVMANSEVWINGQQLGKRPFGYIGFRYELTGKLDFGKGKHNVIAVRADNAAQPASRWYAGAGIYRHVRLIATNSIHIEQWGTFITTPQVTIKQATVRVQNEVINQSDAVRSITLEVSIFDPHGRIVQTSVTKAQPIDAGTTVKFEQEVTLSNPQLWNLDSPKLYRAVVRLRDGSATLDNGTITFGIRDAKFVPATGFWLNGKSFKIKGVCLHHDGGAFGAAVPLGVWERRLELLKQLGVNAIRTAHNPPAPEFLDLCDRMGLLVMDEMFDMWTVAKNPYDYHLNFNEWATLDTRDTVRRDRNHPSVIVYSAGNEIRDTPKPDLAKQILRSLVDTFHQYDPTRPVSQALFRPNVSHDYDNGLADLLDVVGQNYRENEILAAHQQKPARKILGTENGHDLNIWLALRDNAPYAGQFLWAGIDYLGEARQWPAIADDFGLLDRTGAPKPRAFQRQSWWSDQPMVFITRRVAPSALAPTDPGWEPGPQRRAQVLFPDWTPRNTAAHAESVEVYSNCEQVELFLNGQSLGAKPRPANDAPRNWQVTFAAGTLKAVGKNGGQVAASYELRTAGKPTRIVLSADRNKVMPVWDDVAHIQATVVDENGVIVPAASDLITFKITGSGVIAAVDDGDNNSHEPFQASQRHAYQGRCVAFVKARAGKGQLTLTAAAPGLTGDSITIATAPSK